MNAATSRTSTIMCADGVLAEHIQCVTDVARANGGLIIPAEPGMVVVAFDSASAAVASGVEMQQVIGAMVASPPIRIGLATGDVDVGRRRVHRDPAAASPANCAPALTRGRSWSTTSFGGWPPTPRSTVTRRWLPSRSPESTVSPRSMRWIGSPRLRRTTSLPRSGNPPCRCLQGSPRPFASRWSAATPNGACSRRRGIESRQAPARWC